MTQITANLMEKNIVTNCFMAAVLALDGLTKKHFGHYAILKLFTSDHQVQVVPLDDIFYGSNYSKFNGKDIMTNCFMATVLALDGLTKEHFGHYAVLKLFPSDHQVEIVPLEDIFYDSNYSKFNGKTL